MDAMCVLIDFNFNWRALLIRTNKYIYKPKKVNHEKDIIFNAETFQKLLAGRVSGKRREYEKRR